MSAGDIFGAIWKIVAPALSARGRVIILLLVLFAVGAFSLKHYEIPTGQLLIPSIFAPLIVLYLAFEFRTKSFSKWVLLLGLLMLGAWGYWCYTEAMMDRDQIRRLMANAAHLKNSGDSEGSLKEYEEARVGAQKSKLLKEEMDCLYEIGNLKYLMSDYKGAKDNLKNCEQLAIQLNLPGTRAYALSRLGDIARFSGDTGLAGRLLNEALSAFTAVGDAQGQAGAYRGLGNVELRRNTAISRQHFEKARQLFIQVKDRLGEAGAVTGLGDLNSLVGHTEDARNSYSQALAIYQQLGESDGQGDVYRGIGDLNRHLGSLDNAERNYSEALGAYQRAADKGGLADVYRGMGDCAQIRSLTERAHEKYDLALNLFEEIGNRNGAAQVRLGLGELDHQTNKDTAKRFYMNALSVYFDTQSREGQGTALRHLGDLEASQNQHVPARKYYQQAMDAYTEIDNQIGEAEVWKSFGDLETKLNKLDAARRDYQTALNFYQQVDSLSGVAQIQKDLGDLATLASAKANASRAAKIEEARQYYDAALQTFEQTDNKIGQAVTLDSKAIADRKGKDVTAAQASRQKSHRLYSDIGISKPMSAIRTNQVILASSR